MYRIARSFLFLFSAEDAHSIAMSFLQLIANIPVLSHIIRFIYFHASPKEICGLKFPNNVGMAAGFDKNAKYLKALKMLGFGHIEIGTITPLAQSGNDKPRLFRLKADEALINRMGFNNDGVDAAYNRLLNRPKGLIIGGNIGKNKITPNENAADDYIKCFEKLYPVVDYFTVNVSSPNTPNLRELQEKDALGKILHSLNNIRENYIKNGNKYRPIFLKIAPDLNWDQINDTIDMVIESKCDGMVISNTTIDRSHLKTDLSQLNAIGAGGLSGPILLDRSNEILAYVRKRAPEMPLIGVGGVNHAKSAKTKFENGANLVQIYTSFIYQGPTLVKNIAQLN